MSSGLDFLQSHRRHYATVFRVLFPTTTKLILEHETRGASLSCWLSLTVTASWVMCTQNNMTSVDAIMRLGMKQQAPARILSKTAFWNETTHWKLNAPQLFHHHQQLYSHTWSNGSSCITVSLHRKQSFGHASDTFLLTLYRLGFSL